MAVAEKYLVSLLWRNNGQVLVKLAERGRRAFATIPACASQPILEGLHAHGAHLRDLHGGRLGEIMESLRPDAQMRVSRARDVLPVALGPAACFSEPATRSAVAQKIGDILSERLAVSMAMVDGLNTLNENEGVAGLLLNESETQLSKVAALWAKNAGVPSFMLTHGANLGRNYTVTGGVQPDHILVFGERGREAFVDDGFASVMSVTGNPTWDGFAFTGAARPLLREALLASTGFDDRVPVLLFATTWTPKLSALDEPRVFARTVSVFLRACAMLEARGVEFNVVVKGRPSNGDVEKEWVDRLALEIGFRRFAFLTGDMKQMVPAADAVVSYDSNVSIEAMLARVPAINLWTPTSWFLGPFFGANDALPSARYDDPDTLAALLERTLLDADFRAKALAEMAARESYFHVSNDGNAAGRVATYVDAKLGPPTATNGVADKPRYVWEELSAPVEAAAKGSTAQYYDNPRHEVIALFRHDPKRVVDVGCGGGATGYEIKTRFPNAEVIGVEMNPNAAEWASRRVDRVLNVNVETIDWAAHGIAPRSIDTILFPDVLEHLRDPWNTLVRVKPFLSADAQVLASIPNARNLWLLTQLAKGYFTYAQEGLLDITHIRFFTLQEMYRMFHQTGYEVEHVGQVIDSRARTLGSQPDQLVDIQTEKLIFRDMSAQDVNELKTLQFLIRARPVHTEGLP